MNQLRILVQKKKLVEVTITEGWFSEQELSSDFGWKQCMSQLTMNQLHHTITIPDVLLYIVHYSPCRIIHTTLSNVIAIHMEHAPWSKTITDQSLLPMPLQRHNMYDGSEEFWVIIKEEGRRQDSLAYEETHEKKAKAGTKLYYHMLFSETFWHQLFDSFVQPGRR